MHSDCHNCIFNDIVFSRRGTFAARCQLKEKDPPRFSMCSGHVILHSGIYVHIGSPALCGRFVPLVGNFQLFLFHRFEHSLISLISSLYRTRCGPSYLSIVVQSSALWTRLAKNLPRVPFVSILTTLPPWELWRES